MPQPGDRHTTLLRLARDLRYICDRRADVVRRVLMQQQWVRDLAAEGDAVDQTIKDACDYKYYATVPKQLRDALQKVGAVESEGQADDKTEGAEAQPLPLDEWGAEMWAEEMRQTFGRDTMVPVRQGVKTLSAPMKLLGADLAARRIVYNDNPIDEWCLMNTSYEEDKNGNIQPKKTNNPRKRIDGAAALLDAYTVFLQKEEAYRNVI